MKRTYSKIFIIYFVVVLLIYYPTLSCGVVFDHLDYVYNYKDTPWHDFLYPIKNSAVTCLYLTDILYFLQLKLIPFSSPINGILSLGFHSGLCTLVCVFANKIFCKFCSPNNYSFGILVGAFTLVSPFSTEVTVWRCGIYFTYISILQLLGILSIIEFQETKEKKYMRYLFVIYVFSLFTSEYSFVFIPIYAITFFFFREKNISFSTSLFQFVKNSRFLFIAFLLYLLLRFLTHGSIIGHYGAETHLNFHWGEIIERYLLYVYKHLFFITSFDFLSFFKELIKSKTLLFLITHVVIMCTLLWLLRKKINLLPILYLTILFVVSIFPVSNLMMADYTHIIADRYGYLPSIFLYLLSIYIVCSLSDGWGKYIFLLPLFACQIFLLVQNIHRWNTSEKILQSIESFDFGKNNHYFLVNMPDNYEGAYLYKGGYGKNPLQKRLEVYNKIGKENFFAEIYSINILNNVHDSLSILDKGSFTYKVSIPLASGNWFRRGDYGASDYTSPYYQVDVDESNLSYLLSLDSIPKQSYLLYFYNYKLNRIPLRERKS